MVRVGTQVTRHEHDQLVVMAAYGGHGIGEVIRAAIREKIDRDKPPLDDARRARGTN